MVNSELTGGEDEEDSSASEASLEEGFSLLEDAGEVSAAGGKELSPHTGEVEMLTFFGICDLIMSSACWTVF